MKFKILLIFIHTKQNFSRELETDVNYLVSPLCEKSFHTDKQPKENEKQKRYIQDIYKKYIQICTKNTRNIHMRLKKQ